MVELCSVCGEWNQNDKGEWNFAMDSKRGGSLSEVDENITYKVLAEMVIEDFRLDCLVNDIRLSYVILPMMKMMVEDSPPVYVRNDHQVQMFIKKIQENPELNRLCVTVLPDFEPVGSNIQSNILDNNRCTQGLQFSDGDISLASVGHQIEEFHHPSGSGVSVCVPHTDTFSTAEKEIYDGIPIIKAIHYTSSSSTVCRSFYEGHSDF